MILAPGPNEHTHSPPALQSQELSARFLLHYHLIRLVVECPPPERQTGFDSHFCRGFFSKSSQTSDLKIGSPVVTLPDAWCYRVSVGTGWTSASIL